MLIFGLGLGGGGLCEEQTFCLVFISSQPCFADCFLTGECAFGVLLLFDTVDVLSS